MKRVLSLISCLLLITGCQPPDVPLEGRSSQGRQYVSVAEVESSGADASVLSLSLVFQAREVLHHAINRLEKTSHFYMKPGQQTKFIEVADKKRKGSTHQCVRITKGQSTAESEVFLITRNGFKGCASIKDDSQLMEDSSSKLEIKYRDSNKTEVISVVHSYGIKNIEARKGKSELLMIGSEASTEYTLMGLERNRKIFRAVSSFTGVYNLTLYNDTHRSKEQNVPFAIQFQGDFEVDANNYVLAYRGDQYLDGVSYKVIYMERYVETLDRKNRNSWTVRRYVDLNSDVKSLLFMSNKSSACLPIEGDFYVKYDVGASKVSVKASGTISDAGVVVNKRGSKNGLKASWGSCLTPAEKLPYTAEYHKVLMN